MSDIKTLFKNEKGIEWWNRGTDVILFANKFDKIFDNIESKKDPLLIVLVGNAYNTAYELRIILTDKIDNIGKKNFDSVTNDDYNEFKDAMDNYLNVIKNLKKEDKKPIYDLVQQKVITDAIAKLK